MPIDSFSHNSTAVQVAFAPGEFVIREKTGCNEMFIITEGQLEVYRTGINGEKITIGMISSGQYVGEDALLLGTVNLSSVVALSPVRALKLTRPSIELQLKTVPPWMLSLTKGLIERLHHVNEILRKNSWSDQALEVRAKAVKEKFKPPTKLALKDQKPKKYRAS